MDLKMLLHPYRFLIVTALAEKDVTVKELREILPNIPQATIYRCIQKLESANLITRASEKKTRGAIETTYRLNFSLERMRLEENSVETYLNAAYAVFFSYVHHKLTEHSKNLDECNNLQHSRFNSVKIHIKKDDFDKFAAEVGSLLQKYSVEDGDTYQLTTFMVPKPNGGK